MQKAQPEGQNKTSHFQPKTKTIEQEHSFVFHVEDDKNRHHINPTGLLVDTRATSPIVTTNIFKRVDGTFKPTEHCMELADGTKTMNVAVKRGDAGVTLKDVNGRYAKTVLKDTLFIPSYPQDIFSLKAATSNGAELKFQLGYNELIHKDGTMFAIKEHGQLYYLNTVRQYDNTSDKGSVSHDVHTWHEILGHCNFEDVIKSQGVVDGMNISGSSDKSKFNCNMCIEGKFVNNRNRGPDARATRPLEIVLTTFGEKIAAAGRMFTMSVQFWQRWPLSRIRSNEIFFEVNTA